MAPSLEEGSGRRADPDGGGHPLGILYRTAAPSRWRTRSRGSRRGRWRSKRASSTSISAATGRIHAKADTYYKGDDGLFHLENNVEVRDLANKDGKEICISGDKVTYDKDWTEARLEGKGKVKYGDLTFESAAFDYRKSGDALTTDLGE